GTLRGRERQGLVRANGHAEDDEDRQGDQDRPAHRESSREPDLPLTRWGSRDLRVGSVRHDRPSLEIAGSERYARAGPAPGPPRPTCLISCARGYTPPWEERHASTNGDRGGHGWPGGAVGPRDGLRRRGVESGSPNLGRDPG